MMVVVRLAQITSSPPLSNLKCLYLFFHRVIEAIQKSALQELGKNTFWCYHEISSI